MMTVYEITYTLDGSHFLYTSTYDAEAVLKANGYEKVEERDTTTDFQSYWHLPASRFVREQYARLTSKEIGGCTDETT